MINNLIVRGRTSNCCVGGVLTYHCLVRFPIMETTTYISAFTIVLWQFRFVCVVYWVGIPLIPGLTDSTGPSTSPGCQSNTLAMLITFC